MADRTLTINHADGDSETYTIKRDKFAGVRSMSVDGNTVTVDHTAIPKAVAKETTFGGSKSITVKREIEPLLSEVVGGASAAYSLRDLNDKAGNNKVVRVRRSSDNHEKDFRAKEIKDIETWVNAQTVLPLDIQELEADGRTGDLVEAAAAYSLRNLSSSFTGSVVEVRRSSDDEEDSFTAADVADGTLEDWVNTDLGITFETAEPTTNAATVTNASSTGFTYSSSDTSVRGARLPFSQSIPAGATISVTIRTSNKVGGVTPSVRLASNASGKLAASATPSVFTSSANGTQTFVGTTTSTTTSLAFFDNNVGSFDVSDVTINYIKYDGHVSRWYDQSGNANHATQGTNASQPQIVDGGSLVSGGLSFDGDDDFFNFDTSISFSGTPASIFALQEAQGSSNDATLGASSAGNSLTFKRNELEYNLSASTIDINPSGLDAGDEKLLTVIHDGTSGNPNVRAYLDGSEVIDGSPDPDQGSLNTAVVSYIGKKRNGLSGAFLNGVLKELIIYVTDQSDNRTAIEANIGEVYSIDLPSGVDTGYDQVDGFVETWYDQSGNGNDAVQQVSGSQPKIVDGGVLVTNDEGNPAIQGATGKSFNLSAISGLGDVSVFFVGEVPASFQALMGWSTNLNMIRFSGSNWEFVADTSDLGNMDWDSALTSGDTALFNFTRSSGNVAGYANSVASATTSNANSNPFGLNRIFTRSNVNYNDYKGKASELIIYNSDQSANRAAIETNINDHYDIYA